MLGGGTVEHVRNDYGIDLLLFTYSPNGEGEGGAIFLQVKASEELKRDKAGQHASYRIFRRDLVRWLKEPFPVILIAYDAKRDCAHWLHVQGYFAALPNFNLFEAGATITVYLPAEQVLGPATIRQFADLRDTTDGGTKRR